MKMKVRHVSIVWSEQMRVGPNSKRLPAFTLIELLVVICIVVVLTSILVPALKNARESATAVSCLSNMHQASMCMNFYLNDNHETFPPDTIAISSPVSGQYYWDDLLKIYINQQAPQPGVSPNGWFHDASPLPRVFKCPKLNVDQAWSTRYNGIGYNNIGLAQGVWADNWVRTSKITKTSDVIVFADAYIDNTFLSSAPPIIGYNVLSYGIRVSYRHPNASANAVFVDGHAEPVRVERLGLTWATFYQKYPWMETWH